MIERVTKRFFYNTSTDRVVVTLKSSPCVAKSVESRFYITEIFQNLASCPELLNCDTETFEKASILHDGQQWILTAEALVPKPISS